MQLYLQVRSYSFCCWKTFMGLWSARISFHCGSWFLSPFQNRTLLLTEFITQSILVWECFTVKNMMDPLLRTSQSLNEFKNWNKLGASVGRKIGWIFQNDKIFSDTKFSKGVITLQIHGSSKWIWLIEADINSTVFYYLGISPTLTCSRYLEISEHW